MSGKASAHMGDTEEAPGSWLQHGSVPAVVATWESVDGRSLSPVLSLPFYHFVFQIKSCLH